MRQKEKEQQRYLEDLHESCNVIWKYLPSSLDADLSLIHRPMHILDWCDEKMFEVDGFISHVSGNFINKLSNSYKVNIVYSNNLVRFFVDSNEIEGIGHNPVYAISDWIKKNTEVESVYYDVKIDMDKSNNYS